MRDASGGPVRDGFVCVCCGRLVVVEVVGVFGNPRVGSPARFCGRACGQAGYRRRRAGAAEDAPLQLRGGRGRRLRPDARPAGEAAERK